MLTIDLQEGFNNDSLLIRINDEDVFQAEEVTTRLLLGLARSIESNIPIGLTKVEIIIQSQELEKIVELDVKNDTFLGISIQDSDISHIVSDVPFRYE